MLVGDDGFHRVHAFIEQPTWDHDSPPHSCGDGRAEVFRDENLHARHPLDLDDLVFTWPDGRPMLPDSLTNAFSKMAAKANLTDAHLHSLRHTHASLMLREGVSPKVVQERLGHATIAITLDLYSHVMPGMQEDAAARVDRALKSALGRRAQHET